MLKISVNVLHIPYHMQHSIITVEQYFLSLKHLSTFRTLRTLKFLKCSQRPDEDNYVNFLQLCKQFCALHTIGCVKYFTNDSCKWQHKFSKLTLSLKCQIYVWCHHCVHK